MRALPRAFALMGRAQPDGDAPQSNQSLGILLLLIAIFCFTLMDATARHLRTDYGPAQIVWARFVGNIVLVMAFYRSRFFPALRSRQPWTQLARALSQLGSVALFFTSLGFIGLAEATAIMDLNPVLITLGAAIFLGEGIGWRRALGIGAALCGALIVIRPGAGVFQPAAILPLIGAFTYAAGAILTRMARFDALATSIVWSALIGTLATSLIVPFHWQPIALGDLWAFALLGVFGGLAQALIIRAFSLAEAGAIAPFGYTGLLWAALWGWLIWGDLPDRWTVIGAAIIVGAGLYVWSRERQNARASADEDPA